MKEQLQQLSQQLNGELLTDSLHRSIYATDASVYRKIPLAVAYPKNVEDIKELVDFAWKNKTSLIPRAAGTSLAGQCVGEGIVVDVSKHFTKIISIDLDNKQVTVQPGVIRDELNDYLKPYKLFFGPNTSTSNRCMIGGMVGNNSSGTTSIQYGVTRDKVVAMDTVLSNGEIVTFSEISSEILDKRTKKDTLEASIYLELHKHLNNKEVQLEIKKQFPKKNIHRRNTGYAIDELLDAEILGGNQPLNLCKLLTGSEGTLAFTTAITLQLDDLPPAHTAMVVTHYNTLENCLLDVVNAMQHQLHTCEMMDNIILERTKENTMYRPYRFFVKGDPKAMLLLEVKATTQSELEAQILALQKTLFDSNLNYHNVVLKGNDINKALHLRKAGLGLLGNMIGDKKAVACIEDTAVALEDLPAYIGEFTQIMKKYNQDAVYYAHAGAGELHLRPILNLKTDEGVDYFRKITTDVAHLVKKYRGSFSGEHGDGIVRAEYIPLLIGDKNYELLKQVKTAFDPHNIFNPGKIVEAYKMDESLRYEVDRNEPEIKTLFNFENSQGILRLAEKCNGSGDCRKSPDPGGVMCPSYHATKNEKDTTRARANMLREVLTNNNATNKFNSTDLKEVFDLCLSCKACSSECPSNVDIATTKAEFLYQYQKENGASFATKLFANSTTNNKLGAVFPSLTNTIFTNKITSSLLKKISGVAKERSLPTLNVFKNSDISKIKHAKKVVLFVDEFSKYLDGSIARDAVDLLKGLKYNVEVIDVLDSARAMISKGFLDEAKIEATKNIDYLKDKISETIPLLGIEPSAILGFRDEYLKMVDDVDSAQQISENTYLIEEFLASEIENGNITAAQFTKEVKNIKIHIHCHQKAMSNQKVTFDILNLPLNYKPTIITSGCCGMAGSFGYEKEHYQVSMKIGELKLFPSVRKTPVDTIIAANGTSCRHQIKDGTQRQALHPITILYQALLIE
ncbi:oxidoreductase [Patiriisocius marinistellae]|uniref:Oxidoreductase n=1 Tax=Patiriisocius marinistellae TaxID=2494560 RepID=A0A5J4FW87_9FLAO|nr:FAD-binding and (Fe-S)-binding domain-containing protein [Patiriisocius marinistellae]GEQ86380.1 oxidoreductase [Patiriisocius marinistellae]